MQNPHKQCETKNSEIITLQEINHIIFGCYKERKLFPGALKDFEFSFQNLDFNKVLLNFVLLLRS